VATAELWFDPSCPWTWLTSRWLLEVERVRDVQVRFHVMSLSVLHERAALSPEHMEHLRAGWGPVRVVMATELSCGPQAVRDLYMAMAPLIHEQRHPVDRDLYAAALTRARLPHTLANAADATAYDDAIRASHQAGLEPVGGDMGSPIIHLRRSTGDVVAYWTGPAHSPRGSRARCGMASCWRRDGIVLRTKRVRTGQPSFD
jgi:hypothetical protein